MRVIALPNSIQQKSNSFIAEKLRDLAEVLSTSIDNFKELALKASLRKPQLILTHLASETYKYYTELVAQIQELECKLFSQQKTEDYSGEWRVIPFTTQNRTDNSMEIYSECSVLQSMIQNAYDELLGSNFISTEQRRLLEHQLNGLLSGFLKL